MSKQASEQAWNIKLTSVKPSSFLLPQNMQWSDRHRTPRCLLQAEPRSWLANTAPLQAVIGVPRLSMQAKETAQRSHQSNPAETCQPAKNLLKKCIRSPGSLHNLPGWWVLLSGNLGWNTAITGVRPQWFVNKSTGWMWPRRKEH